MVRRNPVPADGVTSGTRALRVGLGSQAHLVVQVGMGVGGWAWSGVCVWGWGIQGVGGHGGWVLGAGSGMTLSLISAPQ